MPKADTKQRILDSAERLFAEQGFAATSLRSVINAAEVNLAAVHYHFGSKEGLIRAVFARRLDPMNRERLRLLDAAEAAAGGEAPPIEEILQSFIGPVLDLARTRVNGHSLMGALFGRVHTEPGLHVKEMLIEQFSEVIRRYTAVLAKARPELPPAELIARFHFVIGAMAATFADPGRLHQIHGGAGGQAVDLDTLAVYLVQFLAGGLRSSPTDLSKYDMRKTQGVAGRAKKKSLGRGRGAVAKPGRGAISKEKVGVAGGSKIREGKR